MIMMLLLICHFLKISQSFSNKIRQYWVHLNPHNRFIFMTDCGIQHYSKILPSRTISGILVAKAHSFMMSLKGSQICFGLEIKSSPSFSQVNLMQIVLVCGFSSCKALKKCHIHYLSSSAFIIRDWNS